MSSARRRGVRALGAAILVVAVASSSCSDSDPTTANAGPRPAADAPSVLVLVLDTVRADRCSFLGYERPTTPRLAEFAKHAIVYRRAYVPGGWTGPTHASLFCGMRPEHHGLLFGNRLYLTDETRTLAEVLSSAGWSTAAFSGNTFVSPRTRMAQGFGTFVLDELLEPPFGRAEEGHRRALDFMRSVRDRGRPFFVFVNDFQCHVPYRPAEPFASRFVGSDVPPAIVEKESGTDPARSLTHIVDPSVIPPENMAVRSDLYDAEIAALDDAVGRFLDAMREAGILENTLVVITSDHGEHFGERGYVEHFGSLHLPILHVPLIVRRPGPPGGGAVVDDLVRIEDVFPTVLDACGLEIPDGLDGESLFALDPDRARVARAVYGRQELASLRLELPRAVHDLFANTTRSVVDGRWHLVSATDGREELFDVGADPLEATDVASAHPDVVERLRALLPDLP